MPSPRAFRASALCERYAPLGPRYLDADEAGWWELQLIEFSTSDVTAAEEEELREGGNVQQSLHSVDCDARAVIELQVLRCRVDKREGGGSKMMRRRDKRVGAVVTPAKCGLLVSEDFA